MPGQLFLTLVQMIVVPLVFASIVRGLAAGEDVELLKKMGLRVVLFFLATTTVAILIGVGLSLLIRPGDFVDAELVKSALGNPTQVVESKSPTPPNLEQIPQTLVGLLPKNPLGAMVESDMLQIVLFAIVFGVALINLAPIQSKPLLDVLGSLQEVCMTVVKGAMRLAPLAVFGLLAQLTSKVGLDVLLGVSVYMATVLIGLLLVMGMYPVILLLVRQMKPSDFLQRVREVQLLAFSTSAINVTGDLVACAVMDEWVGGNKSAETQLANEAKREKTREKLGGRTF